MLREFREFITRGNLVEIAVGLILALTFAAVVTAFVNIVLSLIAAIFGSKVSFNQLTFELNGTPIPYGAFLTALFTFVVIAFILFLIVRAYNRLRRAPDPTTQNCAYCKTDIPIKSTRCPNCTSELQAVR